MSAAFAPLVVASARPEERGAALNVFFYYLDDDDRAARIERVVELIACGEVDADGLFICRRGGVLVGAMVGVVLPGATGMLWPPRALAGVQQTSVEDHLVQHASRWLCQRGCKFGQALLAATEMALGAVLQRNGYGHITNLLYLRNDLAEPDGQPGAVEPAGLTYQDYTFCDRELFHATLLASYEDSLDCPELNDARTAEEIVRGYRGVEGCRPERWWLVWHEKRPAGVLILTEHAASATCDLSYLGLVREARGHGLGRVLTRKALCEAQAAGAKCMTLTMDARNEPARRLYSGFGFEVYDQREVFLSIFDPQQ